MSQPALMPAPTISHSNGTPDSDGSFRYYGGSPFLIHISDGQRANAGLWLANQLDSQMRLKALDRTPEELATQPLCPGCYMVAGFNMMVQLAKSNGQSLTEMANSMAAAFTELAAGGDDAIEHIAVCLDPEEID